MCAISSSSRYNTRFVCSTIADASDATKNSIGCGSPSSDMNARDWDRRICEDVAGAGARSPDDDLGATVRVADIGLGTHITEY